LERRLLALAQAGEKQTIDVPRRRYRVHGRGQLQLLTKAKDANEQGEWHDDQLFRASPPRRRSRLALKGRGAN